jgi:hypothetical protein
MANLYWRGGTANWDGTVTGKWSTDPTTFVQATTIPGAGDAVFFDASSTGTVTIAAGNGGAGSINCTGFTGTLAGTTAISIAGSLTLVAGMGYTYSGRISFTGTATVTTAGKTMGPFTVGTAGITVTLGDAYTFSTANYIILSAGTLTTNNFNVTSTSTAINSGIQFSGSGVKTLNLGSSTITINCESGNAWDYAGGAANLTLNAGTSTIIFARSPIATNTQTAAFNGFTFYNVTFQSTNQSGIRAILGTNTFNNLTFQNTGTGIIAATFNAPQTINGTLNCSGGSAVGRNFLRSNTIGTSRTLTVATLSATDCDFRDITLAGAASPASPTRAGDCKGNSGITFPAAKTVYWNGVSGGNWSATAWATSSGGATAVNNFPLAQDTAIVEATGLNSGGTIALDAWWNIGSIDLSARTSNTMTLGGATNQVSYYGNYTLGTGVTVTGTGNATFAGRTTQNISSAGRTIPFPITIDGAATAFTLLAALTSSSTLGHTQATVNLGGFTLTCTSFNSNNSNTRTIAFGGGTVILTGTGTAWTTATSTNLTVTGSGTVSLTSASAKTFAGGSFNYGNITLNNGGAGALTITGSNTFNTLSNTVQPTTFSFTAGTTTTITNWNINGTAGNLVTIQSATAASHTLSKASGTVSADYLSISRSNATGGATWYAGANSTDGGNNTGWLFSAGPTPGYIDGQATIEGAGSVVVIGVRVQAGQSAIDGVASLTAAGQFVLSGQAAIDGVASYTVAGQRIQTGQVLMEGVADVTAAAAVVYLASAAIEGAGAVTVIGGLLQTASALLVASGAVQISASIKWTQVPDGTEIWNQAADSATTWTPVAAGSETWTRVQ